MNYPSRLLLQPNYKQINFNEKHQNCFLLRHTETQNIIDEFGKLRSDCLVAQTDHLRDYSTNLLPKFTIEDAKIRILKSENFDYFTYLWYEKTEVNRVPKHIIDFNIVENRGMFFLRIGALNNIVLDNFDDSLPSKPVCKVIHTPINANFWHCSIRWFCNDKDSIDMSKNERRRILSVAKTFLIEQAYFELPEHNSVEEIDFNSTYNSTL